jgi:hypothetical protein
MAAEHIPNEPTAPTLVGSLVRGARNWVAAPLLVVRHGLRLVDGCVSDDRPPRRLNPKLGTR